jgi:translation elongation factor P/translation initiation factor 5A
MDPLNETCQRFYTVYDIKIGSKLCIGDNICDVMSVSYGKTSRNLHCIGRDTIYGTKHEYLYHSDSKFILDEGVYNLYKQG